MLAVKGGFHTEISYLNTLGEIFPENGIVELLTESGSKSSEVKSRLEGSATTLL